MWPGAVARDTMSHQKALEGRVYTDITQAYNSCGISLGTLNGHRTPHLNATEAPQPHRFRIIKRGQRRQSANESQTVAVAVAARLRQLSTTTTTAVNLGAVTSPDQSL